MVGSLHLTGKGLISMMRCRAGTGLRVWGHRMLLQLAVGAPAPLLCTWEGRGIWQKWNVGRRLFIALVWLCAKLEHCKGLKQVQKWD